MLILVAVTVNIVINSGLLDTAKRAGNDYRTAWETEGRLGESITIGDQEFSSPQEYVNWLMNGGTVPPAKGDLEFNELTITATESRAAIMTISLKDENTDGKTPAQIKSYLQGLAESEEGQTQLKEMLIAALQTFNFPCTTWAELETMRGGGNTLTVHEGFVATRCPPGIASDEYDLIIQTGTYLPTATYYLYKQGSNTIIDQSTGGQANLVVPTNGTYTVTAVKGTGNDAETVSTTINVTQGDTETFAYPREQDKDENGNYVFTTDNGYKVTVPAGFAYGTSSNVSNVETGFVITDAIDSQGNSIGNEFVWIPVQSNLKVGKTNNGLVMATGDVTNGYTGVLYEFGTWSNNTWTSHTPTVITQSYSEPTETTGDTANESINPSQSTLQGDYNSMIASVIANGGFYVGRYEMGIDANGNATSKLGTKVTNAADPSTSMWYGLYAKAKTYPSPKKTNNTDSVASHMIWGSQYDAMLNFALEQGETQINTEGLGNHTGNPVKAGTAIPTNVGTDKIINIYDLGGNYLEWISEAHNANKRVNRGGVFKPDVTVPASNRGYNDPYKTSSYYSSRLALYVK